MRMLIGFCLPGAIGWQGAFADSMIEWYCLEGEPTLGDDAFPSDAVKSCGPL